MLSLCIIISLSSCTWASYNVEKKEGFFISFKEYNRFVFYLDPDTEAIFVIADQVVNNSVKDITEGLTRGLNPLP